MKRFSTFSLFLFLSLVSVIGTARGDEIDELINGWLNSDSSYNRCSAIDRLGEVGDDRAINPLIHLLLTDSDFTVRQHAANAIVKLKNPKSIAPLVNFLFASIANREMPKISTDDLIQKGLTSESWLHRKAAIESIAGLSYIGADNDRFIAPLIKALEDENEAVRASAAVALGDSNDERAVEPLINALVTKHGHFQNKCIEALGCLRDPRAIDPLENLYTGRDSATDLYIKKALKSIQEHK